MNFQFPTFEWISIMIGLYFDLIIIRKILWIWIRRRVESRLRKWILFQRQWTHSCLTKRSSILAWKQLMALGYHISVHGPLTKDSIPENTTASVCIPRERQKYCDVSCDHFICRIDLNGTVENKLSCIITRQNYISHIRKEQVRKGKRKRQSIFFPKNMYVSGLSEVFQQWCILWPVSYKWIFRTEYTISQGGYTLSIRIILWIGLEYFATTLIPKDGASRTSSSAWNTAAR